MVKAGLLPRLANHIVVVYVEATAEDTENRLLRGLRKHCPGLTAERGLSEAVAALRRGHGLPRGKKALLVLDQFEQWLHAYKDKPQAEIVQALRQCDGGRVQCLLIVRDDFWMAVTRLMSDLEIRILQGQNFAAVDLFDSDHAKKVLAAFGRSFGRIADGTLTCEQEEFLSQAVSGLAQDGKVVSVRLAVFAEMVKSRPWTPATLKDIGGMGGVGISFLEGTFSASTASPEHRYHQKAVRAVLKALLPPYGNNIRGHMRSYAQLLEASGYAGRPRDFDHLIRILDSETRLITPTDPEGMMEEEQPVTAALEADGRRMAGERGISKKGMSAPIPGRPPESGTEETLSPATCQAQSAAPAAAGHPPPATRYYQLTHDYLVVSVRDWLARKQKETRQGRAELRLQERTALWEAKPVNRQLPAWWEWAEFRLFTRPRDWTPAQQKMMRKATGYHVAKGLLLAAIFLLVTGTGYEGFGRLRARELREQLLVANTTKILPIVEQMAPYRRWLDPGLREAHAQAERDNDRQKYLRTSLALLPVDPSLRKNLYAKLLDAEPGEVSVLCEALEPYQGALCEDLWAVVETSDKGKESQRLRAAAALAQYDSQNPRWSNVQDAVAEDLVQVTGGSWLDLLRPLRKKLFPQLAHVFRDPKREETERLMASNILAEYMADNPAALADLLEVADPKQFAVLYLRIRERGAQSLAVLMADIEKKLPADAPGEAKEEQAKRQANAAVALLRLGEPAKVWPLLKHSSDPRRRSHLIHRLSPMRADAGEIINRLDQEPDVTIRRALLLSLGEYGEKELSPEVRKAVLPKMQELYRIAADPGLHASAEWLLREWQQEPWLKRVNDEWAKDTDQREKRLQAIQQSIRMDKDQAPPQWYVNSQGQTMVVIPGPVHFVMGSPPTEADRQEKLELQHDKRISRTFAIAAKPVTVAQYRKFDPGCDFREIERWARTDDSPMLGRTWFQAAKYCNWLSKQEGLPESEWCYAPNRDGQFAEGMRLAPAYLKRTGYRLPTEAEIEYVTRAGASTSRYFGETEELLPKYARYLKNSMERAWPVGSLKPNDWGFFDLHGNASSWCQERWAPASRNLHAVEDDEDRLIINAQDRMMVRGGYFLAQAPYIRSALRASLQVTAHDCYLGFRPARTIKAE